MTLLLLVTEILIALFVHDRFVRPYVGDYLVVILLYCAVKSFFNWPVLPTAIAVLAFSYVIEALQYFNLVGRLGLQHNQLANTIIGNSFAWEDMVAYMLGIVTVVALEKLMAKGHNFNNK